ncbi:MAG: hypothetical protein MK171_03810 [Pirellulales bacterium]|nr:hypothetical protein [Pirellulales bacterium]
MAAKKDIRIRSAIAAATACFLVLSAVGCGTNHNATVTQLPDAFRRLEMLGYRQSKDSQNLGQRSVSYNRSTSDADFSVELVKWVNGDRIKEVVVSCHTDEAGFRDKDARLAFWGEMQHDFCSLVSAREDYLRAASSLEPVEEDGAHILRHEGCATTADGWQILVIEDVGPYKPQYENPYKPQYENPDKPQYENPEKNWVRVGSIWATHLETDESIPAEAIRKINQQLESAKAAQGSQD